MSGEAPVRPAESWQAIACRAYRATLFCYPPAFRARFGAEMAAVFADALAEHAQRGWRRSLVFLAREWIDAPASILDQHLAAQAPWTHPIPLNLLAFSLGFGLLGLIEVLNFYQGLTGPAGALIYLLSFAFAGGLGGLAIGSVLHPQRKKGFALGGAVGFLLANTLVQQLYLQLFPDAFAAPRAGIYFLIPFLYPLLAGSVFGLSIAILSRDERHLIRWAGWGSLALLAGFIINRLSAALIQSYLLHNTISWTTQIGFGEMLIYLGLPQLLEGLLLGILFGGFTRRSAAVEA